MIAPGNYIPFDNEDDYRTKGISWGLISDKAKVTRKEFVYKGAAGETPAELVGYLDAVFAVIRLASGELHSIHPAFLKEMQAAKFVYPTLLPAGGGTSEEVSPGTDTTDNTDMEQQGEEEGRKLEEQPQASAAAKAAVPVKPPQDLPDGKVKLTAVVDRFDSRYDPFSESDQEIIVFDQVRWLPEAEEGFKAWSSLSATLKKADLQVKDHVTMEGKLAGRKLNAEVAVKINNAAKIAKT